MDIAEMTVRGGDANGGTSVLRERLTDYAKRTSPEPGTRPEALLTDAERGDLAAAEIAWGVPRGLLLVLDRMMMMISPGARVDFAHRLCDAAPERRDQAHAVGGFIEWLLVDPVHGARAVARNDDVAAAIAAVADAQWRTLAGAVLTRADWSAIRKIATTGSDAARDGRASHFAALCAEAAAWPPAGSASVGVQTLEPWGNIAGGMVDAEQDWTMADYDALQAAMKTVWEASGAARDRGDDVDLDAMMLVEAPALAPRWERHLARTRALSATRMAAACDAIVDLLTALAA